MAKTDKAVNVKGGKLEMVVTSAMTTALSGFTTAEDVDLSSVIKSVTPGALARTVEKEHVIGDSEAISTYSDTIDAGDWSIVFLYTNGEETIGTDNLDPYDALKEILTHTADDLSVQFIWSPAGGASGDQEHLTDANETYLLSLTPPAGNADGSGKIQFTLTISTTDVTEATVS